MKYEKWELIRAKEFSNFVGCDFDKSVVFLNKNEDMSLIKIIQKWIKIENIKWCDGKKDREDKVNAFFAKNRRYLSYREFVEKIINGEKP